MGAGYRELPDEAELVVGELEADLEFLRLAVRKLTHSGGPRGPAAVATLRVCNGPDCTNDREVADTLHGAPLGAVRFPATEWTAWGAHLRLVGR